MKNQRSIQEHREIHGYDPKGERSCPLCERYDWIVYMAVVIVVAVIASVAIYLTEVKP